MWSRNALFVLFPVLLVLAWCSIPFPYTLPPSRSTGPLLPASPSPPSSSPYTKPREDEPEPMILDFPFFLFIYYGTYNAVALAFITHIFKLYSLDWWPRGMHGLLANFLSWCSSLGLGYLLRYHTPWYEYTLAWVLLTFLTMSLPLIVAFQRILRERRNVYRHSLSLAQRTFAQDGLVGEAWGMGKIPSSYKRFLWFCLVLLLAYGTLCAGGWYAYYFVSTLPHSGIEGLLYVYSWVGAVYALDFVVEGLVEAKIRSYPLCNVLRLYFYLLYFIFYRNLFARLRDVEQFAMIQIASSVWVTILYPMRMTRPVHRFLSRFFSVTDDYHAYIRTIGQSFFARNLAENASMLAFLSWVTLLHFGPNAPVYPYFAFDTQGDPYTYRLTMTASLGVWASELISSYITRTIFKRHFGHSITREAVKDMKRFPEMIPCLILVILHVLMDMLLALLKLHFV
ncbi:MAG: hypothetical protein DHS80DRAFT_26571 [Piptocephalis tieghemiana]|nr:MAG: hypothetical protein DHS80DRAFT_26571 [Piptocephalis tieghemiana]